MKLNRFTALAAGAILLTTAACGGESLADEEEPSGSGADSVQIDESKLVEAPAEDKAAAVINAITPDEDLAASVPADVREEGLRMTTSEGYPPMEMFATDGETLIGLDPSLGRAISRKLGLGIDIANEDFNSQIPGVVSGRYDVILSSMTDNAERQAQVTFVDYVSAGAGFIVKAGNPEGITTPEDMCGQTISVVDNGSSLDLAEEYAAACTDAGSEPIDILKFPGDQEALLQVRNGRAAANITDYVVAATKQADPKLEVEAVAIEGTESPWGIAMAPDDEELIESVQGALDSLIESGEYADILAAWGLDGLAVESAEINGGE